MTMKTRAAAGLLALVAGAATGAAVAGGYGAYPPGMGMGYGPGMGYGMPYGRPPMMPPRPERPQRPTPPPRPTMGPRSYERGMQAPYGRGYGAPAAAATAAPASKSVVPPASGEAVETAAVSIDQMRFDAAKVTIKAGGTVTWSNRDAMPHTVTANDGSFGSEQFMNGGSFSHTFTEPGTYSYYCQLHPSMRGTVVVVD